MTVRPFIPRPWQIAAALDGRLSMVAVMLKEQPAPSIGPEFSTFWHWRSLTGSYIGAVALPFAPGDLLVGKETWNLFQCSRDGDVSWPVERTPKEDPRDDPDARSLIVVDYPIRSPCAPGYDAGKGPWRSPVTMPRWASRMTWEVTEVVRVCRVQDMTEEEARACGASMRPRSYGFLRGVDGLPHYDGWSMDWSRVGTLSRWAWGAVPDKPAPLTERDVSLSSAVNAFVSQWAADHGPDSWERNPGIGLYGVRVHQCNVKEIAA